MRIAYIVINANRSEGTSRAVLEVAERIARDHEVDLWARTVKDADLSRIRWQKVLGQRVQKWRIFSHSRPLLISR